MCLLRPGDLVFDVGANIGYPAILFAHLVGLRGKVVAFEASPRAFRLLLRATEADANVACLHAAASDSVGERRFFETESLDTSSLEPVPGVEPCIVPTTTLDIVSARMGTPAFVKIDVEGHEPHVLRGMQALLGSEAPPALMFEALTSRALAESSAEIRELGKEQYSLFRIRGDGTIGSLEDPQGTNNYLALPGWCRERLGGLVQH
jgi:FkbM family methyltransferase